jgi:isopentenyl-diphosphate delta-isomerase
MPDKVVVEEPIKNRQVVLVDRDDNRLGLLGIWEAHSGKGVMHRAISILLHDGKGRVLLQRRSEKKPLWPLYWSNSVCTHPFDGEAYLDCAVRRLTEEMGVRLSREDLSVAYRFDYQSRYDDKLSEYELDTVVVGRYSGKVEPDPDEVAEYRWIAWGELEDEVERKPEIYTPWFKLIVEDKRTRKLFE